MTTAPQMSATTEHAPSFDGVLIEREVPGVAVVRLNRPKARNALSMQMMNELSRHLRDLSADPSVKAIVLAAEGPAFCAGHDLKELTAHRDDADKGRAFYAETMRTCSDMMQLIVNSEKPVIAAVHALATAAGCQLVATCDLAVAAKSARFCTPGVNIGLFCSTPMVALSRNVSRKRAMEMLLLGDLIAADDAVDFGLINKAVADEEVFEAAMAYAQTIAAKSSTTVAIGKRAFYDQIEKPLTEAYDFAADVMTMNMLDQDAKEGIGAFLEKREPNWQNPAKK